MTPPHVSVVIPTRNRWRELARAAGCALAQEAVEIEVIVVDDGSAPPDRERAAVLSDPRVRILRHESSRGLPQARNTGIAEARGEWLAFLDDDDLWAPHKLRTQLAAARSARAPFAYASAVVIDESGRVIELAVAPDAGDVTHEVLTRNAIPAGASNVVARTDVVRELHGFDEQLPHLADWDLWIRLAERARAASCPEVLVAYVHHAGNMLLRDQDTLVDEFEYLAAKHSARSLQHGVQFDRLAFTRWLAWGNRRAGRRGRAALWYLRGAWQCRSAADVARAAGALLGEKGFARARGGDRIVGIERPVWLDRVRG